MNEPHQVQEAKRVGLTVYVNYNYPIHKIDSGIMERAFGKVHKEVEELLNRYGEWVRASSWDEAMKIVNDIRSGAEQVFSKYKGEIESDWYHRPRVVVVSFESYGDTMNTFGSALLAFKNGIQAFMYSVGADVHEFKGRYYLEPFYETAWITTTPLLQLYDLAEPLEEVARKILDAIYTYHRGTDFEIEVAVKPTAQPQYI